MDTLEIVALVLAIIGIVGSFLPVVPGPPLSAVGLLMIYLNGSTGSDGEPMTLKFLIICFIAALIVSILDYVIPAKFTKITGGHKEASTGALIGMAAGIIFTPIGMLTGALIGAFIGEFIVSKDDIWGAAKAALGTFLGFITTIGLKFITCCIFAYYIVIYII